MSAVFYNVVGISVADGSDWGLVAAVATAVAALATLGLRELQRRREDLDQKVGNAVSAGLGRTLLEFRQLEEGAKARLDAVLETAAGIEQELRERLEVSETRSARLAELLEAAADVVPQLEGAQPAVPSLLVFQAMSADQDKAMAYLAALLNSELASSDELAAGGALALRRLGASALALDLYAKAAEVNPRNADAAASAIRLRTRGGQLTVEEGIAQMTTVISEYPRERNALSEALNLFVDLDDYQGMLEFVDQLLEADSTNPLLWRNRGIALDELHKPKDEVIPAFRKSFDLALQGGDESEASNTARPYAGFLLRAGEFSQAQRVLERALSIDPRSSQLLNLRGDLELANGDFAAAEWCYRSAIQFAGAPGEKAAAEDRVQKLRARQELVERGLVPPALATPAISPDPRASQPDERA